MPSTNIEELAFEFFKLFSKMEYALKATGIQKYLKNDRNNNAFADWEEFISKNSSSFSLTYLSDKYILNNPPKIQKVDNSGNLVFSNHWYSNSNDLKSAIEYLKTVRNNLFHGGKGTSTEFIEDNTRNKELLKSSIEIIKYIKTLDSDVKSNFDN
ncbi:hypothetical protein GCM10012288_12370 [Malaciobacter pacificus]|uniref:Uncharacterized protein n=1 Tax=Malaciobacter pacificus TaxID=1080223 RepID=A0A5C2H5H8_9BACT|nr:hypothetical protein [Malaciobacter pacificus]QEP34230.1 hypothetical protein APAC_1104 [Malaciobacter pacificus]GGD39883.1 hypothetical protein GCM10012288_12370 [Malaciobacter pacificus]